MSSPQIAFLGARLSSFVFSLVAQTFFFGIYTLLIVLSTRMLLRRGIKTKTHANFVMLLVTLFMYILAALYFTYNVVNVADRIRAFTNLPFASLPDLSSGIIEADGITELEPIFNAVILVNYIFGDAVVIWRAWIISQRRFRVYLWPSIVFFFPAIVGVFFIIGFRIALFSKSPVLANLPSSDFLVKAVNILQISALSLSLMSNLAATLVVGATSWFHRQTLRAAFADEGRRTMADQVMTLVAESGVVYTLSAITLLIASLLHLNGIGRTLGDLYGPVNFFIASAYPSTVLLLLDSTRSSKESTIVGSDRDTLTTLSGVGSGLYREAEKQKHKRMWSDARTLSQGLDGPAISGPELFSSRAPSPSTTVSSLVPVPVSLPIEPQREHGRERIQTPGQWPLLHAPRPRAPPSGPPPVTMPTPTAERKQPPGPFPSVPSRPTTPASATITSPSTSTSGERERKQAVSPFPLTPVRARSTTPMSIASSSAFGSVGVAISADQEPNAPEQKHGRSRSHSTVRAHTGQGHGRARSRAQSEASDRTATNDGGTPELTGLLPPAPLRARSTTPMSIASSSGSSSGAVTAMEQRQARSRPPRSRALSHASSATVTAADTVSRTRTQSDVSESDVRARSRSRPRTQSEAAQTGAFSAGGTQRAPQPAPEPVLFPPRPSRAGTPAQPILDEQTQNHNRSRSSSVSTYAKPQVGGSQRTTETEPEPALFPLRPSRAGIPTPSILDEPTQKHNRSKSSSISTTSKPTQNQNANGNSSRSQPGSRAATPAPIAVLEISGPEVIPPPTAALEQRKRNALSRFSDDSFA